MQELDLWACERMGMGSDKAVQTPRLDPTDGWLADGVANRD